MKKMRGESLASQFSVLMAGLALGSGFKGRFQRLERRTRTRGSSRVMAAAPPSSSLTQQISPLIQTQVDPEVFNFGVGQPGPDLLEKAFSALTGCNVFEENDPSWILQYGTVRGSETFRRELVKFYNKHAGSTASESEVICSTGVSGGLQLLGSTLGRHGDVVFVEQPTYFLVKDIFDSIGLVTEKAPMQDGAIDFDLLTKRTEELESGGRKVAFLYCVPVHSNPTAKCYSKAYKEKIIEFYLEKDITLLADEVYELLNFGPRSVKSPPFRDLIEKGGKQDSKIISVSSFSKICGPGLRLGWILAGEEVVSKVKANGLLKSGGGLNPIVAGIMTKALEKGLMEKLLVEEVQPNLRKKCESLCEAIDRHLPECSYVTPEGGYFIFLTFPEEINCDELFEMSGSKHKVKFTPGSRCFGPPNSMRLSFAFYGSEEMEEGVLRLRKAIDEYKTIKS